MIYQLKDIKDLAIDKTRNIYIDVGTAIDAPHSAKWILEDKDALVIAIEPNPACIKTLKVGRESTNFHYLRLNDSKILLEGNEIQTIKENQFLLINCAIDDVDKKTTASFYCTDERNVGCSSLLEPTPELGLEFEKGEEVEVASLEYILDSLGLQDLTEIRFVKTDTQGKDFDVIKSLGKYLPKVVGLKCEYNVKNFYENSNNPYQFADFVRVNGFNIVAADGYDFWAFNNRYSRRFSTSASLQNFFMSHSPDGLN